jgi:hypothetical protein
MGDIFTHTCSVFEEKNWRKIQFTPLRSQGFLNLNSKVSKLAVYPPEVSKSDNLNLPSNSTKNYEMTKLPSSFFLISVHFNRRFKLPRFETSGG